jgi:hypothetical protein
MLGSGQLALGNAQFGAQQSNQSAQGWGQLASLAASYYSDENVKENKRPMKGREFIKAIKDMRVERWKYLDGVADGGEHIGTYAQDFAKATGVGDGHTIDVASVIGVLQGGLKEVIKTQERMERRAAMAGVM